MAVASPCIDQCRLDSQTDICAGCWRTGDEIARWRVMSDVERLQVLQDIRRRRAGGARDRG
jgi:predicted Fe-S protein YdhL (DUF1289 family)